MIARKMLSQAGSLKIVSCLALCAALLSWSAVEPNEQHQTMQTALKTLDNHLRTKRPDYYQQLRPPLTDLQIADLEKKYKVKLPASVRLLYKWKNGQNGDERFVNNCAFMPLSDALESHAMLTGMIGSDFEIKNWWNENWIPLFENGGGDNICVDIAGIFTGSPGQLIDFWHDSPRRNVIAPSLEAFLATLNEYYAETKPEDFDEFFIIKTIDGYPKRFELKE